METRTVTLAQAKAQLSKLTKLAAAGETVIITRHGRAVARVVPPAEPPRMTVDLTNLRAVTDQLPRQQESVVDSIRRQREAERY